jgi:serine/threonine protein kinase
MREPPVIDPAAAVDTTTWSSDETGSHAVDRELERELVRAALFDGTAAPRIGRFAVGERLGAGASSVVYAAWDDRLARRVAVKIFVASASATHDHVQREARALAQLSHRNVVAVYEVGDWRGHAFIAMELISGTTLARWQAARRRSLSEIIDAYLQAGRGLAAAHQAGLVHRDFKPENAIIGDDSRLRVVDFGLACEVEDPESAADRRRPAGTPRFMAPEIKAGAAVTPAADQYSFCIALAESLKEAQHPPPRWVAAVTDRGCATEPGERFASMAELLRALARDPVRTRRRIAMSTGLAAAIGAIAFVIGWSFGADLPDSYAEGVTTLGAEAPSIRLRVRQALESYIADWLNEYRDAENDRRGNRESPVMSDRRTICLWRSRDALAVVRRLLDEAARENLPELSRAVQSMPDPRACADLEALAADIAPTPPLLGPKLSEIRRQVTQADILVSAGRYAEAFAEAGSAVTRARAVGFAPVLASALLVQGHARMNLPDRRAAVPILTEAWNVAMVARADAVAVEAWARRVYAQATSTGPDGAVDGAYIVELIAQRTASAGFARALLYNNLGTAELARERRAVARDYFRRALTVSPRVSGAGALELIAIRANLGLVADDRVEGDGLLADAEADLTRLLGANHPDTLEVRRQRGFATIENLRQAAEVLIPVCRAYERIAALGDRTARCWTEVGLLRWDLQDRNGAIEALKAAVAASREVPEAGPYLLLLQHDTTGAIAQFEAAIAAYTPTSNEHWWDRLQRARFTLGLGRALRQAGTLEPARGYLEQAVAELDAICRAHPSTSDERRLGRARVELTLTLVALEAPRATRDPVAAQATEWLRRAGAEQAELRILRKR